MVKMVAEYSGEMHCELIHEPSGSKIETDAPKDNQGRGEKFSPTDLMGASLSSCALTTMAIVAKRSGIEFSKARASATKEMNPSPRRVAKLNIEIHMPPGLKAEDRKVLENAALNCPVALSLHPEVEKPMVFQYPD